MISCVALFVSLSGVGYAAATIGSSQIKNNAVQGKDIKNSSVTGKDIKTGSVSGSDLKNNGVTGTDVNEASLGQVPSAAQAANATNATTANNATALGGAAPPRSCDVGRRVRHAHHVRRRGRRSSKRAAAGSRPCPA